MGQNKEGCLGYADDILPLHITLSLFFQLGIKMQEQSPHILILLSKQQENLFEDPPYQSHNRTVIADYYVMASRITPGISHKNALPNAREYIRFELMKAPLSDMMNIAIIIKEDWCHSVYPKNHLGGSISFKAFSGNTLSLAIYTRHSTMQNNRIRKTNYKEHIHLYTATHFNSKHAESSLEIVIWLACRPIGTTKSLP